MTTRTKTVLGVGVVALVAVGVAVWWFFIRDDAPEAVSIDDATESAEEAGDDGGGGDDAGGETDEAPADGFDGTWEVDTSVGSFDDFSGSFAGYRVEEELASIGSNTAVGRTPDVTGSLTIDGTEVTDVEATVDVSTLESDEPRRDSFGSDNALDVAEFPEASFTLTEPVDLGEAPSDATTVDTTVDGELTLHGVTNPVEFELQAEVVDDLIVATGSTTIDMTDFDITPPAIGPVVSISDQGEIEFQLFFSRAA